MSDKLKADEVAVVLKARQILKAHGLDANADVKTVCQAAGISRKTGYQWAGKFAPSSDAPEQALRRELEQLKADYEALKKRHEDVCFENEGRKLAWEIHEVDKMLAEKKSTTTKAKKKKR